MVISAAVLMDSPSWLLSRPNELETIAACTVTVFERVKVAYRQMVKPSIPFGLYLICRSWIDLRPVGRSRLLKTICHSIIKVCMMVRNMMDYRRVEECDKQVRQVGEGLFTKRRSTSLSFSAKPCLCTISSSWVIAPTLASPGLRF